MARTKKECELFYEGKKEAGELLGLAPAAELQKVRSFGVKSGWQNMLIHSDNLGALRRLIRMKAEGSLANSDGTRGARLIYIDPPFSTMQGFRKGEHKAYDDKLTGAPFLDFLRARLVLLKELLSDDGSIFVHLDWKKAHYIKVLMDEVFGEENFLNDIIWSYGGRGAKAVSAQFSRNHDIILWYRKASHIFNQVYVTRRIRKGDPGFRMDDEGRWFKTSPRGDYTDKSIEELESKGRVYRTRNGNVRIKYFLREEGGWLLEDKLIGDVWDDIPDAMHMPASEKTGYPTQKPEALLSRIIQSATNKGDLVIDAFSGSGTALAVAEKLDRRWAGIDSGSLAIQSAQKRLLRIGDTKDPLDPKKTYGKNSSPFAIYRQAGIEPNAPALKFRAAQQGEDLVITLEGIESGGKLKPARSISYVMPGKVTEDCLEPDSIYFEEDLKKTGHVIRLPLQRGPGAIAFADEAGVEGMQALSQAL